ncbi:alpha/beta hydrolase [Tolypothrix sp. VBCCA 56010]|uniref:alpha/beta hydrolase n=1 Tax=Tolypothrix sp. VBCCA 56010 TaxID=3137731 RepID=UPI003D7F00C1
MVWDLPGLGKSSRPKNNDYSVEKYARDLETVVAIAGDKPVFLLGHSMGGIITLTFSQHQTRWTYGIDKAKPAFY